MKYALSLSVVFWIGNIAAMELQKGKEDLTQTVFARPAAEEGETYMPPNQASAGTLAKLFPQDEADLPLFYDPAAQPSPSQDEQKEGNLHNTLFKINEALDGIDDLPQEQQAEKFQQLTEQLLQKKSQNAHAGLQLSQAELEAAQKLAQAQSEHEAIQTKVERNAEERRLQAEISRKLAAHCPDEQTRAELEKTLLQGLPEAEAQGFLSWATSWLPSMRRCTVQ